jgi:hypothetical protein
VEAYYDLRASEYDEWYLELGRFDGLERPHWDDALNEGSRWTGYKRYFTGPELAQELGGGATLLENGWFAVVSSSA